MSESSLQSQQAGFDRVRDRVFKADDDRHEKELRSQTSSSESFFRSLRSALQNMLVRPREKTEAPVTTSVADKEATLSVPAHAEVPPSFSVSQALQKQEKVDEQFPSNIPEESPEAGSFEWWKSQGYDDEQSTRRVLSREFTALLDTQVEVRDEKMTIARIDVSPSDASFGPEQVTGIHGYLIRHVPLYPREVAWLGLTNDRSRSYRATYVVLDGADSQDLQRFAQMMSREQSGNDDLAQAEFRGIAGSVLDRQGVEDPQTQQSILLDTYTARYPNREILMILAHGATMERDEENAASTQKYVVQLEGNESVDTIDYFLKAEVAAHPDEYSVVLDRSCNKFGVIPDVVDLPIPYFGSLDVVGPGLGKDSVVIADGKITHFAADTSKL